MRKSRKYHYFTVRGREVFDGLERQAVALDHVAVGEQILVAPVAIVRRLPGEPGRPACGAGGAVSGRVGGRVVGWGGLRREARSG